MKFGMVGDCWQPLIPKGQALEEVFGRLCVGSSHTSSSALAPLGSFLARSPCPSQIQGTKQHEMTELYLFALRVSGQCWGHTAGHGQEQPQLILSIVHIVHCSWNTAPFITAYFC